MGARVETHRHSLLNFILRKKPLCQLRSELVSLHLPTFADPTFTAWAGAGQYIKMSAQSVPSEEVASLMKNDDFQIDDYAYTGQQKRLLQIGLCLNVACVYLATGVLAAFYPKEAMQRGMSQTELGYVFAIYPLTWFLSAPLWGTDGKYAFAQATNRVCVCVQSRIQL
jgi:hypothetical protein